MAYTVKKLSELSGVSVRTLHYYDEIQLLEPAFVGGNGYRFYEEEQVLRLQQILFYRELGFALGKIREILKDPDFDALKALESHRTIMERELAQKQRLIRTLDRTIQHLKGKQTMQSKEMFYGLDSEQQQQHEAYLVDRFGEGVKPSIEASKKRVKDWTQQEWKQSMEAFADICIEIVEAMSAAKAPESDEAQSAVRRHYQWLCQFWTPDRASYQGFSQLILDSDLRKPYSVHHDGLPEYLARGIEAFAAKELS